MPSSFELPQLLNNIWNSLVTWFSLLNGSGLNWIQTNVMPIYYAHKQWIWFCFVLLLILETVNLLVAVSFKQYVKKNSLIYKEIKRINYEYPFYKIPQEITFYHFVNQRTQYDNCNLESYSRRMLKDLDSDLYRSYTYVERNRKQLGSYDKCISRIQSPLLSSGKGKLFQLLFKRYEEDIYRRTMAYPETNPSYSLIVEFRSPAGRHSAKKRYSANHAYMRHLYDLAYGYTQYTKFDAVVDDDRRKANGVPSRDEQKEFEKAQRSKMTKSLRLQILKRDNYTCQYCGKYMPDGVGAQVDHIIPVSKGGLSEPNNLQTLCSICNGRKGNRL